MMEKRMGILGMVGLYVTCTIFFLMLREIKNYTVGILFVVVFVGLIIYDVSSPVESVESVII